MLIATTIADVRKIASDWKAEGYQIGLVPTMGYLHEGHVSLIHAACAENERVIVSIFVNPMQFGPQEDLSSYPRDFQRDREQCEQAGAHLVFAPDAQEMYRAGFCSFVDMTGLTDELCGASRPGHFRGVCTVVTKLFNITKPNHAYFGEKDAQQLAVIKQMTQDLNMDITIVGCPTVREADGLAKSSRNSYLSSEERAAAPILYQSLLTGKTMLDAGERRSNIIKQTVSDMILTEPLAQIDYVSLVDAKTLASVEQVDRPVLLAIAVLIGKTKLIDNIFYQSI